MLIDKGLVAQRVREAREYRNITQLEMANHLGIARQTYLDVESGRTEPKILSLATIASVTGRPLTWLLYGESTSADIGFAHREEINSLLMLFSQLPPSAREMVMNQALQVAEYMSQKLPTSSDPKI